MKVFMPLVVSLILVMFVAGQSNNGWRGNYYKVVQIRYERYLYCACWYWWWRCSYYRYAVRRVTSYRYLCRSGWTHNGDKNCIIPICQPNCRNNGKCIDPNVCDCPDTSKGPFCAELTCSYQRPCYPGNCTDNLADSCQCSDGFLHETTSRGCTEFDPNKEKMKPEITKSNITLSNYRRVDNYSDYMFILQSSNEDIDLIWSNQKRFNHLQFEVESYFEPLEGLPERPAYVHDSKIGVVETLIEANVSKIPRDGGIIRDPGSFKIHPCSHTRDSPVIDVAKCTIIDDQFTTLIEHGDWLHVAVKSSSGGYQRLFNTDQGSLFRNKHYYKGLQVIKSFQFNFDFIAPKHCTQAGALEPCPSGASILEVAEEFTKVGIRALWSGWTDDLSGIWQYYVEVFKLGPDQYGRLIETHPINPVFSITIDHSNLTYPKYLPNGPGMYSVLVETRDVANNSRIARRLVLFDNISSISLNTEPDGQLFISSAVPETGYMWQTTSSTEKIVEIRVRWANHFRNEIHEENKLLNEVEAYPIQFEDIEADGLLFARKYVAKELDDFEGKRSRNMIPNYHGIVKFEMAKRYTLDDSEPTTGWETLNVLSEETAFHETLDDGARVRVWIRATDAMGNRQSDSTLLRIDGTVPSVSYPGQQGHKFVPNVEDGVYNYTSRVEFIAKDDQSGVHKLFLKMIVHTDDKEDRVLYEGFESAMVFDTLDNAACDNIEGKCFISSQNVQINNCWFLINKEDLDISNGTIEVTAYNQALLTSVTSFNIGRISDLKGLEKYDGPTEFKFKPTVYGFQMTWTLPEEESCYGRATIVITLITGKNEDGSLETLTFYTSGNSRSYSVLGLKPKTTYPVTLALQGSDSSSIISEGPSLSVTTAEEVTEKGVSVGVIVGVALAVLAIVAVGIIIFAILVRRGVLSPPAQHISRIRETVRRRAQTIYGGLQEDRGHTRGRSNYAYDNRQSELYIYGGMDMSSDHDWDIDRRDVTFESLIKDGHFANIYKARLQKSNGASEVVVAKTLKENYSSDDEFLMKAKINFTGKEVGNHPNILTFVGAVLSDKAMGPFIIYEYCEKGTLKDYLVNNKTNLTIELQENLFRFGLDIAKGMEYLAGKGIVHRRLAARNILLTFLSEVKISGFGPQPANSEDGDAEVGKKERIPIKWMAPECMESTKDATEKSDVWSYAVVLWEIFSMGETPYTGKGRDLPQRLKRGERLSKPEQCDDVWYNVMKKCWEYKAQRRPRFSSIRDDLDTMFVASPGDDYYYYKR